MRETVNLKALKRSKSKKHHTIFSKAHRLIQDGFKTPELTDSEVMEIANAYPSLGINIIMGGDIIIKSIKDTWIIRDEGRFYTLYHKGIFFDNGRMKEKYHVQDVFMDLNYIFASIVSHDDYALGIKKRNAQEVFDLMQS